MSATLHGKLRKTKDGRVTKPIVIIIENPEADPDIYTVGDVEVIMTSSYPVTKWASEDRKADSYVDYAAETRALADSLPVNGDHPAVRALLDLADEYERAAEADRSTND